MRLYGTYKNLSNEDVTVDITSSTGSDVIQIGDSGSNVLFAPDPVHISSSVDDTFTTIIKHKCKISLITKEYLGSLLFASNARDISVTVTQNGKCIFAGYVVPCTYSQPYANVYDSFTINCVDKLSTLEKYQFDDVTPDNYDTKKPEAAFLSFETLLKMALGSDSNIYYDQSRSVVSKNDRAHFFDDISVNTLLFYGSSKDDVWNYNDIVNEMLKFTTLNIMQIGNDFYIFDYNTLKKSISITFNNLKDNTKLEQAIVKHTLKDNDYSSADTNVSIDNVYNQIQLKCELEQIDETIIESPFDADNLTSPYTNKNALLTEVLVERDGENIDTKDRTTNKWYFQYYNNKNWKLYCYDNNTKTDVDSFVTYDNGTATYQTNIAKKVNETVLCPLISKMGKVKIASQSDNSVDNKIDMSNYIIISINGAYSHGNGKPDADLMNTKSALTISKWNNIVDLTGGIMQYNAKGSGTALLPTDDNVTNYLVFNGTIALQPKVPRSTTTMDILYNDYMPIVTVEPYNPAKYPNTTTAKSYTNTTLLPYLGYEEMRNTIREYYGEWLYYRDQQDTDTISKVPILVCELQIGDKYCVETDESVFEWLTAELASARGYKTTFSLGIDPKIDDYLLCTEYQIQTTPMNNIDKNGTGIPIKKSDKLSGNISFKILSPAYTGWSQQIRRHPTAFRSTQWWTTNIPIMEFVDNIYIKDFECNIVTDNAGINNFGKKDLVYMSNTEPEYMNKKDNITFKLNTQLNTNECLEKEVDNKVNISGVYVGTEPLTDIKDHNLNATGKAEEVYINHYWDEYNQPKVIYLTDLHLGNVNRWERFYDSHLKKTFFPLEWNINPTTNTVSCKLKEL